MTGTHVRVAIQHNSNNGLLPWYVAVAADDLTVTNSTFTRKGAERWATRVARRATCRTAKKRLKIEVYEIAAMEVVKNDG